MLELPSAVGKVRVPPIKSQGIKTKLVPFIMSSVRWSGSGRWIEPFVGSAVVCAVMQFLCRIVIICAGRISCAKPGVPQIHPPPPLPCQERGGHRE